MLIQAENHLEPITIRAVDRLEPMVIRAINQAHLACTDRTVEPETQLEKAVSKLARTNNADLQRFEL